MNTPVVLITGALTGIGRATALAFASDGARVVASGRRPELGYALVKELRSVDGYRAVFDSNVLGVLLSLKHELRVMLPQKHGSIVNISSTYGRRGGVGASVYSASKHAVEGLTQSAALEAA